MEHGIAIKSGSSQPVCRGTEQQRGKEKRKGGKERKGNEKRKKRKEKEKKEKKGKGKEREKEKGGWRFLPQFIGILTFGTRWTKE